MAHAGVAVVATANSNPRVARVVATAAVRTSSWTRAAAASEDEDDTAAAAGDNLGGDVGPSCGANASQEEDDDDLDKTVTPITPNNSVTNENDCMTIISLSYVFIIKTVDGYFITRLSYNTYSSSVSFYCRR